jgi:hypothetical protein
MTSTRATGNSFQKAKIHLSIPRLTPSNNKLIRMHYMELYNLNKTWLWEITYASAEAGLNIPIATPKEKRTVNIISYRKRRLDPDNFEGGLKPLIDALKKRNLIYDDHEKYIDLKAYQAIEKDRQRTEITISWEF